MIAFVKTPLLLFVAHRLETRSNQLVYGFEGLGHVLSSLGHLDMESHSAMIGNSIFANQIK